MLVNELALKCNAVYEQSYLDHMDEMGDLRALLEAKDATTRELLAEVNIVLRINPQIIASSVEIPASAKM